MLERFRRVIARNLVNYSGWTTKRKIVVFESDDWGSIRMPSKKVYQKFSDMRIPVDESPYCRLDSLATEEDLNALFELLMNYKDSKNNHPVITANVLVANPNFNKIKESDYTEYHFEKFTDTLKKYPGCQNSFEIWKEGIRTGLFYPQFHGREHINVLLWLKLLQQNHKTLKYAFDYNFWGLSNGILSDLEQSIQAAYDCSSQEALNFQSKSIIEGLNLFEEIFGYRSESFIASNYIWDPKLEKTLFESGVDYIQGMKYQLLPRNKNGERNMIRHYIGDQNRFDQIFLVRNCVFEPSLHDGNYEKSTQECLKDISNAFFWNKPAIITAHRLNFIGSLDSMNRNRNLKAFNTLLKKIIEKWPNVEFMTSVQLGRLIKN